MNKYGILGIFSTGCIQSDLNQLEAESYVDHVEDDEFCPDCGCSPCVCEFDEVDDCREQICKCGEETHECICWFLDSPPDQEDKN